MTKPKIFTTWPTPETLRQTPLRMGTERFHIHNLMQALGGRQGTYANPRFIDKEIEVQRGPEAFSAFPSAFHEQTPI